MFEFWCEYDINPIIIFDTKGNIKYCNREAEIFLSYINLKEVHSFTLSNAPAQKGMKTVFENIRFKDFEFMGYSIGYEESEYIGIRLFINTNKHSIEPGKLEKIELSMLLNFAIEYVTLKNKTLITTYFDPSIPPLYTNKKELLDIILKILENRKEAQITTKIEVGEYIKINKKKYPLIEVTIKTEPLKRVKSSCFEVLNKEYGYTIKIPFIKEIHETDNT